MFQTAQASVIFPATASAMSTIADADNGGSFVLFFLSACSFGVLFHQFMSRNLFLQANTNLLLRLALELTILAFVCFTTAIGVLSIYHTRVNRWGQQPSEQSAAIGVRIARPFDFAVSTHR